MDPSQPSESKFLEEYFDVVLSQSASYYNNESSYEIEDLFQLGFVGLITAINNYNPERGPLRKYIKYCVRNQIKRFLCKQKGWDSIAKIPNADLACNPEHEAEKIEKIINDLKHKLLPIEGNILSLKAEGYTKREICQLLALNGKEYYDLFFSAIGKIQKNET